MGLDHDNKPRSIFEVITTMISDAHAKVFDGIKNINDYIVERFTLPKYKALFPEKKDQLFNPALGHAASETLRDTMEEIHAEVGKDPLKITFIPVPFDLRGKNINFDKKQDESLQLPPHILMTFSKPQDASGLCHAVGWLKPMPLLKLIPKEIADGCCITVEPEKFYQNPKYLDQDIDRIFQDISSMMRD